MNSFVYMKYLHDLKLFQFCMHFFCVKIELFPAEACRYVHQSFQFLQLFTIYKYTAE